MATRRIVALGGHEFKRRPEELAVVHHLLAMTGVENPRVCFIPTAGGDDQSGIADFYLALDGVEYRPSHVSLFRREHERIDLRRHLLAQDLIYVAGGSMLNLLAVWRAHGLPRILARGLGAGRPARRPERRRHVLVRLRDHRLPAVTPGPMAGWACCRGSLCVHYAPRSGQAHRLPARGLRGLPGRLRARRRRRDGVRGPDRRSRRSPAAGDAKVVRVEPDGRGGTREIALRPDPLAPPPVARRGRGDRRAARAAPGPRAGCRPRAPPLRRAGAAHYDRGVALPLKPPVKPQLALSRKALPEGEEWTYEPKYDGFRARRVRRRRRRLRPVAKRQAARPLLPRAPLPGRASTSLDGELVILGEDGAEVFDALQNRIHPAESRINMLAEETPGDLPRLRPARRGRREAAEGARSRERRERLAELVEGVDDPGSVELTPIDPDPAGGAEEWLASGEGVIAKQLDAPYRPGERKGMVKVKRLRTADCVVVGWRPGKEEGTVGSLILGLYDARRAARRRPHLGPEGEGEARAGRVAGPVRDRRARLGRPQPLGCRPRARVDLAAAGAGGRGHLRPRRRRAHPPRLEDRALARRQGPGDCTFDQLEQ